jgi:hypothetical protein
VPARFLARPSRNGRTFAGHRFERAFHGIRDGLGSIVGKGVARATHVVGGAVRGTDHDGAAGRKRLRHRKAEVFLLARLDEHVGLGKELRNARARQDALHADRRVRAVALEHSHRKRIGKVTDDPRTSAGIPAVEEGERVQKEIEALARYRAAEPEKRHRVTLRAEQRHVCERSDVDGVGERMQRLGVRSETCPFVSCPAATA